jgi:hypothetical protein
MDERKMLSSINGLQEAFSLVFAIQGGFGKCNIRFLVLPENRNFDGYKEVHCEINRI